MKASLILLPFVFALAPAKAQAQLYQESLQEKGNRKLSYDEFLVEQVRSFPEVKKKENEIIERSNYENLALFFVTSDGLGTYTVKMLEDNGKKQILHLQYIVDSATGKITSGDSPKK